MSEKPTYKELEQRVRELEKAESEREKTEQKLLEMESYQRALLDAVPDTLFLMKPDGTILAANYGLANNLDIPVSEMKGKKASKLVPEEVAVNRRLAVQQALKTGAPVTLNDVRSGKDIESRIFPIEDNLGKVAYLAIFARDITQLKKSRK